MTKFSRTSTGKYSVAGKTYETLIGSRAQVWHGTSYKTTGGLTHSHLMKNKSGNIVSKAKHFTAKKEKRLVKAGYLTKKGHFGFIKNGKSKKHRGGAHMASHHAAPLSLHMKKGGAHHVAAHHAAPLSLHMKKGGAHHVAAHHAAPLSLHMKKGGAHNAPVHHAMGVHPMSAHHATMKRGGRRHRGGSGINLSLSPSSFNGKGVGTSGVDLQFIAGNAN